MLQVSYIGQPIGMVVAQTQEAARNAAEWLQDNAVTYQSKSGGQLPTVTLQEAILKESYFFDRSDDKDAPDRLLKVSQYKGLL